MTSWNSSAAFDLNDIPGPTEEAAELWILEDSRGDEETTLKYAIEKGWITKDGLNSH